MRSREVVDGCQSRPEVCHGACAVGVVVEWRPTVGQLVDKVGVHRRRRKWQGSGPLYGRGGGDLRWDGLPV